MNLVLSEEEVKEKYKDNTDVSNVLADVANDAEALMKAFADDQQVEQQVDHSEEINEVNESEYNNSQNEKMTDIESLKSTIAMEGTIAGIDESLINQELAEFAIEVNKQDLQNIPVKYRTKNICLTALSKDMSQFKDVPENIKTKEFVSKCITMNPGAIKFIGAAYLDKELVEGMLLKMPSLIRDIPDSIRPSNAVLNEIVKKVDTATREYMISKYNGKKVTTNNEASEQKIEHSDNTQVQQNNENKHEKTLLERVEALENELANIKAKLGV